VFPKHRTTHLLSAEDLGRLQELELNQMFTAYMLQVSSIHPPNEDDDARGMRRQEPAFLYQLDRRPHRHDLLLPSFLK
jgi:hypothetical protein